MSSLNDYFDAIVIINLARNVERLGACVRESHLHHFGFHLFEGYDYEQYKHLHHDRRPTMTSPMCGCSISHAAIHHGMAFAEWKRILVLEDDFEILHPDFNTRFAAAWSEVPPNWDIVYLGCGYGTVPTERVSKHVVRAHHIKTTSSYAITAKHARFMAPLMATCNGPDDTLSAHNPYVNAYSLYPCLIGQRACRSDIWGTFTHNTQSMTDPAHAAAIERLPYAP